MRRDPSLSKSLDFRLAEEVRELPMTDRIGRLREQLVAEPRYLSIEQALLITASYRENEQQPRIIQRARALARVLELVGTRGIINIELKGTAFRDDGLETAVGRVAEQANANDHVLFSSFNPFALYRIAHVIPRAPRGLLYAEDLPIFLRRAWLRPLARPTALHPKHTMISPAYVTWAHGKGYAINTWTVNEPEEMRRLIGLGIHAIITNKPDVLGTVLAQSRGY